MIALALSCNPSILIADEPTTALDVTVQAQILELMQQLQDDFQSSIMLITHNLGRGFADGRQSGCDVLWAKWLNMPKHASIFKHTASSLHARLAQFDPCAGT